MNAVGGIAERVTDIGIDHGAEADLDGDVDRLAGGNLLLEELLDVLIASLGFALQEGEGAAFRFVGYSFLLVVEFGEV